MLPVRPGAERISGTDARKPARITWSTTRTTPLLPPPWAFAIVARSVITLPSAAWIVTDRPGTVSADNG